jgi:hypothetical protein
LANETDFLELYRELGVSPECCLNEFKQAYRRHVARLHPDRQVQGQARIGERLQQLTVQYSAAMEFQRRHGRLPGAQAPGRPTVVAAAVAIETFDDMPVRSPLPPLAPAHVPNRHAPPSKAAVLLALAIVAAVFWCTDPMPFAPEHKSTQYIVQSFDTPSVTAAPVLSLGMTQEAVRAIEGEPILVRDDRWEYGPSWIRFENGEVVDWYSSPLRTLKTETGRPERQ